MWSQPSALTPDDQDSADETRGHSDPATPSPSAGLPPYGHMAVSSLG